MQFALIAMCLAAGAALPMQAAMNALISARTAGGPLIGVTVNFVVGSIILIGLLIALRTPLPSPQQLSSLPWWVWFGGLCGIVVVFSTTYASPRVGATVAFSAVIAGQVGMSLLCDTFGWFNYPQHALTPGRLVGAALLVAGVVMIRKF